MLKTSQITISLKNSKINKTKRDENIHQITSAITLNFFYEKKKFIDPHLRVFRIFLTPSIFLFSLSLSPSSRTTQNLFITKKSSSNEVIKKCKFNLMKNILSFQRKTLNEQPSNVFGSHLQRKVGR